MHTQLKKRRGVGRVALLGVALLLAPAAPADSLKREGLPEVDNVTLIGVEDGKLKYRTAAGDREAELSSIEAVGVDAVPELAAGQKSFAAGELRAAERSLEAVWANSRVDWVRHFAGFYLMQVYDRRGEPVDAATVFAKLASENADVYFLSKPPVASLAEADENQKERISQQVLAVAEASRGEHRQRVQRFLARVVGEDGPRLKEVEPQGAEGPTKNESARKNAKVKLPKALWAITDRAGEPAGNWESVGLLSRGEYQAALDAIKPRLNARGDIASKLFIYGKALLGLAEEKNDPKLYRDAGLVLMRIVAHFNRPGQEHPLVVPAQLEVAYLHQKIGREDIYQRILFGGEGGGGLHLLLDDPKEFPYYRARYYEVIGEELPAENDDQDQP